MFDDFKELLSVLNACRVKYLVVGGYAVSYHAQPRATKDLDILIKPSAANSVALLNALKRFGAPIDGMSAQDFSGRGKFFRMGAPPIMVDILPEIAGVGFDAAWKRRVMVTVDAVSKLKAPFISEKDLIAAKVAAGRPQDIADVDALRKAKTSVSRKSKTRSKAKSAKGKTRTPRR